jgi:hypothetical protein
LQQQSLADGNFHSPEKNIFFLIKKMLATSLVLNAIASISSQTELTCSSLKNAYLHGECCGSTPDQVACSAKTYDNPLDLINVLNGDVRVVDDLNALQVSNSLQNTESHTSEILGPFPDSSTMNMLQKPLKCIQTLFEATVTRFLASANKHA